MRRIGYYIFAAALVALSGCSDDTIEQNKPVVPAETGDEIMFGSSLEDAKTRTVYGDEPVDGAYPVYWVNGDQVSIYCPEAAQTKLVDYVITPNQDDGTKSEYVTKVNADEPGLQWGTEDTHHFYGFYPASRVTGTENGKIRGTVPTTQNVVSWNEETNDEAGTTYYGKTNTDNSYMWAYGEFKKSENGNTAIPLTFHPWMTVLEITIRGPQDGTKTVTNLNIHATGNQSVLAGDFICDMNPTVSSTDPNNPTPPNYEAVPSSTINNTISISMARGDEFITLGPNDKIVVRAYLLPIDENNPVDARNIEISVATLNGAAQTRVLGYSGLGANSIVPHAVNRITLPRLTETGTNYWMSSLDSRIYMSELSIPGSKFSYLTSTNNANPVYQGSTIKTQFLDGVRAFIVQTNANATYTGSVFRGYTYNSGDLNIAGISNTEITLENTVSDIIDELRDAKTELGDKNLECAVVMVTLNGGVARNSSGSDITRNAGGSEKVWIETVKNELKRLASQYSDWIYTDEVTANTTLGDVAGKIIFKVNTNSQSMDNSIDVCAGIPALFTRWVKGETQATANMRWGSPNESNPATLKWMFHEATHVGTSTEITQADKQAEVLAVLENSVEAYKQNTAHDTWYMVDAGGTFYYGSESNQNVIDLTNWLNPIVFEALQSRVQNASTGLVFFNFADMQENYGQRYGTAKMIQTIIDNNFKFNLRYRDDGSTSTSSADAAYKSGGNIWQ